MVNDASHGEHIWLRQSVRFTVGDQRRTLEIAIPVPPGAPADEVEQLLRQASEGMERLTRHLDFQVAALTESVPAIPAAAADQGVIAAGSVQTAPPIDTVAETFRSTPVAAQPAVAPSPHRARQSDQHPSTIREEAVEHHAPSGPAAAPREPARAPQPQPQATRPIQPQTTVSSRPAAHPAPPTAPEVGGPDLSRRDFLAETSALGLTPRQVMERLGVRSLDGLNLREALEVLRRQHVRETGAAVSAQPTQTNAPSAPARSAPTTASVAAPIPTGNYFEEEDDFDISFSLPDHEPTDLNPASEEPDEGDGGAFENDELADLDDVPDFGMSAPATSPAPAPALRGAPGARPAPVAQPTSQASGRAPAASGPLSLPQRARARELIARLRATAAGGTPTRAQMIAYANIVVDQLGATAATGLVQGLWGTQVERLGTDQLNALIQWGKDDDFAEEAPAVAAALQAERAAAEASNGAAPARPARSTRPGARSSGQEPGSMA